MSNEINYELLAKYFSEECTVEEIQQVDDWISLNSENTNYFNKMKKLWGNAEEEFEKSDVKDLWNSLAGKAGIIEKSNILDINESKVKTNFIEVISNTPKYIRYAAAVLILFLLPSLFYLMTNSSVTNPTYKSITVDSGKEKEVLLSDGTKVILDAGSYFQYPEKFTEVNREVVLKGEAFFEVTPNSESPFIVNTNNAFVKVIGTKFNVRSWDKNKSVKVDVTEGKVLLGKVGKEIDTVQISKGFSSELLADGSLTKPKPLKDENSISWLKGEMYFDNTDLKVVLSQAERWYDVSFVLTDSTILKDRVSIFIQKNSFIETLEIISAITDSEYIINKKIITLKSQKLNSKK